MNNLLKRFSFGNKSQRPSLAKQCNYQNNYYGDQVCVPRSSNKSS